MSVYAFHEKKKELVKMSVILWLGNLENWAVTANNRRCGQTTSRSKSSSEILTPEHDDDNQGDSK